MPVLETPIDSVHDTGTVRNRITGVRHWYEPEGPQEVTGKCTRTSLTEPLAWYSGEQTRVPVLDARCKGYRY
ncbi:hypothetical protein HMI54_010742 [Coelomomyces lativittatus]|nr:hypothetical protein HMI54_010742 [Coelomomyces lativittatus]